MILHTKCRDGDLRLSLLEHGAYASEVVEDRSTICPTSSWSGSEYSNETPPSIDDDPDLFPTSATVVKQDSATSPSMPRRIVPNEALRESPRASVMTYASTVSSFVELQNNDEAFNDGFSDEFNLPRYTIRKSNQPGATPSTPSDFSELFPSRRKLKVRHDDTTLDGNMNLRVDTSVTTLDGRQCDMTLFHLRMHDLRTREFSLRRYCRDSGREVCNSIRKTTAPPSSSSSSSSSGASSGKSRPRSLQRSLSNALNSIRPRADSKATATLKRQDSGYESSGTTHVSERADHDARATARDGCVPNNSSAPPLPLSSATSPIKLEFSNYAQVEIKCPGAPRSRTCRYEFDYWGADYSWRRVTRKNGSSPAFHLMRSGSDQVVAYMVPTALSPAQQIDERKKGGWVPPFAMWIADDLTISSQKDISDVIIASGLMAMVDHSIHAHFHRETKKAARLSFPGAADAKRILLGGMFRRASLSQDRHIVDANSRPRTCAY